MNPNTTVPRLFYKKDILFLCCILAMAVTLGSLFFFRPTGKTATVQIEGKKVQTIWLNTNGQYPFENNGHTLTVQVREGKVGVVTSSCRDKICQNTGFTNTEGTSIVCLPAGISVTVEGASRQDAVTY